MREAFGAEALIDGFDDLIDQLRCDPKPTETVTQFLVTLTATAPMFANLAADAFGDPTGPASTVPALVGVDEEQAITALREPGDPPRDSNPRHLRGDQSRPSRLCVVGGLLDDLNLAHELAYHPRGVTTSGRSTTSLIGLWPRRSSMLSTLQTRSHLCDSFPRSRLRPRCSSRI